MSVIIGIDVGGSTTKIVGFHKSEGEGHKLISPQLVRANDPITAIYGAFGKFTDENGIKISDIEKIMMTGVGSSFVKHNLYGIETVSVPEFDGIGRGGLFLAGLDRALVVSMGTGTALVHAEKGKKTSYLGGTGVGGGTLVGLSKLLLKAEEVENVEEFGRSGDLSNIDLRIKDITHGKQDLLISDLTASNFGNVSDKATREDIALGIMNMIYETIGMISIFGSRSVGVSDIVLTGNLTRLEMCERKADFFNSMRDTYGVNFIIPALSEYATAIGCALHAL